MLLFYTFQNYKNDAKARYTKQNKFVCVFHLLGADFVGRFTFDWNFFSFRFLTTKSV